MNVGRTVKSEEETCVGVNEHGHLLGCKATLNALKGNCMFGLLIGFMYEIFSSPTILVANY